MEIMEIKDLLNELKPSLDKATDLLEMNVCEEEKILEDELNKISDFHKLPTFPVKQEITGKNSS